MAFKGSIFIAGTDAENGKFLSGIVFSMSSTLPIDFLYESPCSLWQVEIKSGINDVVARTSLTLDKDILIDLGFEQIQRALDLLSVKGIASITLDSPFESNIGVYSSQGKLVLFHYAMQDLPINTSCEVKIIDSNGEEIAQPSPPEPLWSASFRYYRLSQASCDLFEAYRNLFLGFEALLNEIVPKNKKEREGEWFLRSLTEIHKKINLGLHSQNSTEDPVQYIIKSQYRDVRCKLLHAKLPYASLPHSSVSPIAVKQAYGQLLRIWRHIASIYFKIPNGGGLITYIGFEHWMSSLFKDHPALSYTSDASIPKIEDTLASPLGYPVKNFETTNYLGSNKPGVVRIHGKENLINGSDEYIYRVCLGCDEQLFSISYIEHGLKVSGVDEWESISDIRLINSSQPTVNFKT